METVSGKQQGTLIYIHDGYTYNIDKRIKHTYRCSSRRSTGCPGIAKLIDGQVHLQTLHQHPPDHEKLEKSKMQKQMLNLSRESLLPLKEIFDNVSRTNPEIATHISYNSMRSVMARERNKQRPPIPHTFHALCTDLTQYEWIKDFYKGSVVAQDNNMAAIFSSDKLLEIMQQAQEIFVDGTFTVVPRSPQIDQLYTIHTRYMNKTVAIMFCLCEARTSALYESIWLKILELAPGLKTSVKFIMSDYEAAAMKVLEKLFPNANIHGCWFHYNQAVLRKWNRLGLANTSNTLLSMTMTLPLVPQEYFTQSLRILHNYCDASHSKYDELLQFLKYIEKTWLPKRSKVSVYNCPVRTNNLVENFHSGIRRKLGGPHQNLWIFLDKLIKLIVDQEIHFGRLQNNENLLAQSRKNKERDLKIFQAQTDLITGRLPLEQFLRLFTGIYKNVCHQEHRNMQQEENIPNISMENENEEIEDVPENILLENENAEMEDVPQNVSFNNENGGSNAQDLFTETTQTFGHQEQIDIKEKENVATISLENENVENYQKEIQFTTNSDIRRIIKQPQIVLTRFKRQVCENYVKDDQKTLPLIENPIPSKIARRPRRKARKFCGCCT